jgi:hypothetical protein
MTEGYFGNYTGPYWSDGKFQTSVEFGESDPQSEWDYLSYLHDTAYARYEDAAHREAADQLYNERAKQLIGRFPQLAGNFVEYGNMGHRQTKKFLNAVGTGFKYLGPIGALGGAIYFQGKNMIEANQRMKGTYLKQERGDIEKLYAGNPKEAWAEEKGYAWRPAPRKNQVAPAPVNAGQTREEQPITTKLSERIKKAAAKLTKERNRETEPARVHPESNVFSKEMIDSQRRRLENYQKLRAAAAGRQVAGIEKKKKKKGNVRRAVVIDPYLHLR